MRYLVDPLDDLLADALRDSVRGGGGQVARVWVLRRLTGSHRLDAGFGRRLARERRHRKEGEEAVVDCCAPHKELLRPADSAVGRTVDVLWARVPVWLEGRQRRGASARGWKASPDSDDTFRAPAQR